ncbi:MAG TPA: hypothetical protein VLF18_17045 [Tahibacter sp.]|uniref:hypothetical protein n=1 Tax=Tahibacter sp. TaxID=2056211 RepID=UPI002BF7AE9A|nr:hypothetical protein [Tahibacter sp.]HSX61898.1 hypothetical protein [Tahibacter sp.]
MPTKNLFAAVLLTTLAVAAHASQTTIDGPPGSVAFGTRVLTLPNGNVVVTDPDANGGAGAVHLYTPAGSRISSLTGSVPTDHVGSGGVVGVGDQHFVAVSPDWNNGAATTAGAVTWINGATGLNGFVSSANSLVGSTTDDRVGINGAYAITVLTNGNYVVNSWAWSNAGAAYAGAVTWANGNGGIAGPVSAANSLVGTTFGDSVGASGVRALTNGNYVVGSLAWNNGGVPFAGAATWANGATGRTGPVSASNSLVGNKADDFVGEYLDVLANGNYVVGSSRWDNGTLVDAGAVTVGDGTVGRVGVVSAANSAVGSHAGDSIGQDVTPLADGDYVIASDDWDNAAIVDAGVARWCDGVAGCSGALTIANSLIGTTANDEVGSRIVALANGNYVVVSSLWNNGALAGAGAVTWGNGVNGTKGAVSAANSLVGSKANDRIGSRVEPLANGNYVIGSYMWKNGALTNAGAATWGNGNGGLVGSVTLANSLVGTTAGDKVGLELTALANGNYVVGSPFWNNGGIAGAGAATWGNGVTGSTVGAVSIANSLVGTKAQDQVGGQLFALANGAYVVGSRYWDNGAIVNAGALTWASGAQAYVGSVSTANSFVGSQDNDSVGSYQSLFAFDDGTYASLAREWDLGPFANSGAVTLTGGNYRLRGEVQPWNSVIPPQANGGTKLYVDYDSQNQRLAVGRPAENKVTLFRRDQLFADGFQ